MRVSVQDAALKQLESAIFMYAYDFDEIAVHTVAATPFELLTKRLGQGNLVAALKPQQKKEYLKILNIPNNFFKHGQKNRKNINSIEYDPAMMEHIIMLACEANINGPKQYRLQCAFLYLIHYSYRHQNVFSEEHTKYIKNELKKLKALGNIAEKETLSRLLKLITSWRMPNHEPN